MQKTGMAGISRRIREEGIMKAEKSILQSQELVEKKEINYAMEISWCCKAGVVYLPLGPFRLPACSKCWRQTFPVFVAELKEKK